jgi:hypothetical protein
MMVYLSLIPPARILVHVNNVFIEHYRTIVVVAMLPLLVYMSARRTRIESSAEAIAVST